MNPKVLQEAVNNADYEKTKSILDAHPHLINMHLAENDEITALHRGVMMADPRMVELLLDKGANPRIGIYPYRAATTALAMANDRGLDKIATLLEKRLGPVRSTTKEGQRKRSQLLSNAVQNDDLVEIKALLSQGLDPDERIHLSEYDGEVYSWGKPLCIACRNGNVHVVKILLEAGADPNANWYASGNPLSWAFNAKNDEIIQVLYDHGAKMEPWLAGSEGLLPELKEILQEQPDLLKDRSAGNLFYQVLCGGEPACLAECFKYMKEAPGSQSLSEVTRIWRTMGHRIHPNFDRSKYQKMFRMLLDFGVDPNEPMRRGVRMLHQVVEDRVHSLNENEQVIYAKMLLEYGAKLDVVDKLLQSTPLGWAARWGCKNLVELYLDHAADPELAGAEWANPRAWARKKGFPEIEALLSS